MEIKKLIKSDFKKAIEVLSKETKADREPEAYRDEYENKRTRRNESVGNRPDKTIGEGENKKVVPQARVVFSYPKKIVRSSVSFLLGKPLSLSADDENEAFESFKDVWKKAKMNSRLKQFVRTVFIETKSAILFYPVINEKEGKKTTKIKAKVLKETKDGSFYPYFNADGDMEAFTWKTKGKNEEGKEVEIIRIYTAEYIYKAIKAEGDWQMEKPQPTLFNKIPVVYQEQDAPEWEDVVGLIDRFENRVSKLVDTNDYFSSPTVIIKGEVQSAPEKEEVGKMIEITPTTNQEGKTEFGDVSYLTWDQTPESVKLELDILRNHIYSLSSTPDLSFNNVKGISNVSGIALKLMFLDSILKSYEHREIFEESIERIISVLKAGLMNIVDVSARGLEETEIGFEFNSVLPDNLQELIDMLSQATGGKSVMSQETAIKHNPFVSDSSAEMETINKESETAVKSIAESFV